MRLRSALWIYRILLPLMFLAAFPAWLLKMLRRGGLNTRLGERAACYGKLSSHDPHGTVHIHAVSVGESLVALKLIRAWLRIHPAQVFTLATGTATGHSVATRAAIPGVRVTYAPLDFPSMVRRYLRHFKPAQIILIEGEAWPHLLLECANQQIPIRLVNARMSPRSTRRHARFAACVRPLYCLLDWVAIQDPADAAIWENLGVPAKRIHLTGSIKFDPGNAPTPNPRPDFQHHLDAFGAHRPIILAASTHAGEEAWLATVINQAAPTALPVIVPRHAERRKQVRASLTRAGFSPVLRSSPPPATATPEHVLVIDSTGELSDWTAHADVVIIGKSFRAKGGQNPCEAIIAHKPVIFGPHMENFEPLASQLVAAGGALRASNEAELDHAITTALRPRAAATMTQHASEVLAHHAGAIQRTLHLLLSSTHP